MKGRLNGQVAWITGATSGIGEATARLFVAEGAKVAIVGIKAKAGQALVRELTRAGHDAIFHICDVRREAQVRASIEKTVRRFGRLDILVNNAGIAHIKPFLQCTERDWGLVMNANVRSMFFAGKHAIDHLRRNSRSYIVNVGSISSFVGQALTPIYTVSKHAVLGLTRAIALDFAADGLRCNCVCPGVTDTPMLREHLNHQSDPKATLAKRVHRVPIGRPLEGLDIARTILYLSCEDSSGVTGTAILVDGGYLAAAEWNTGHFQNTVKTPHGGAGLTANYRER